VSEVINLRPFTLEQSEEGKLLLAKLEEVTDRIRKVQNTLGGHWADPVTTYTEEKAAEACADYRSLLRGHHGWETQLARATSGEIPVAKALMSLKRFRSDLNFRRQFAAERILQVGMQRGGDWYCIKGWPFVANVERLLETERSWAPLAAALDDRLDEAERVLLAMQESVSTC
jgi:hypothetical protein